MTAGSGPRQWVIAAYRDCRLVARARSFREQNRPLRQWLARRETLLFWAAALGLLAWLQGRALASSIEAGLQPFFINDDAQQQIFPFYRYLGPSAFDTDYIADYYLTCFFPVGYWGLFAGAARLGIDPTVLSHILPHALWLLTLAGMAAVAGELGGKLGAFAVLALGLGSDAYLSRMGGGLPRTFGFPVLTLALLGLVRARVWWCVAAVILGALFYPVTAVISGLGLAAALLLPQRFGLEMSSWSWRPRLLLLGATAAVSIALLLPAALGAGRYGGPMRLDQVSEFPETGPGGRYGPDSTAPFKGFLASIPDAVDPALLGIEHPWSPAAREWLLRGAATPWESSNYRLVMALLLAIVLSGGTALVFRKAAARRVALLGVASAVGYTLAVWVAPYAYLPERYSVYSMALLGTLAVAASVAGFFPRSFELGYRRFIRTGVVACYVVLLLCLFAGRIAPGSGLGVDLRRHEPLASFIAGLPRDSLIAAWPRGFTNAIPYEARRRVLVSYETHQVFHQSYVKEMRRRMRALTDAYFATSLEPIERLRKEFGVTHLLIERDHFKNRPPIYFKPFDAWITEGLRAARGKRFELPSQVGAASVFSFRGFELLDLSRLASP